MALPYSRRRACPSKPITMQLGLCPLAVLDSWKGPRARNSRSKERRRPRISPCSIGLSLASTPSRMLETEASRVSATAKGTLRGSRAAAADKALSRESSSPTTSTSLPCSPKAHCPAALTPSDEPGAPISCPTFSTAVQEARTLLLTGFSPLVISASTHSWLPTSNLSLGCCSGSRVCTAAPRPNPRAAPNAVPWGTNPLSMRGIHEFFGAWCCRGPGTVCFLSADPFSCISRESPHLLEGGPGTPLSLLLNGVMEGLRAPLLSTPASPSTLLEQKAILCFECAEGLDAASRDPVDSDRTEGSGSRLSVPGDLLPAEGATARLSHMAQPFACADPEPPAPLDPQDPLGNGESKSWRSDEGAKAR
mmetsp:Transcript_7402/g.11648  ORF Transcript_7402/g.11648 Transcript_7402/m.11648 type:complete len:364 (+) Transcript_7402:928-2019(+)